MNANELNEQAVLLHRSGKYAEAMALYQECLALEPGHPHALYNAGMVSLHFGHYVNAIQLLARAHAAMPDVYDVVLGYGIALRQAGHLEDAAQVFCRADRIAPQQPQAMCNLASLHYMLGNQETGDFFLHEATRRDAGFPNVQWLNAMRLLRQKRYREGWPLFESRFRLSGQQVSNSWPEKPMWQGEAAPIAVLREQGHGDCLMMARYLRHAGVAPLVRYVEVTPPLVRLFQHNFPGFTVGTSARDDAPDVAYVQTFMGLPGRLNVAYEEIDGSAFLSAPADAMAQASERLLAMAGSALPLLRPRVAVFWRGSRLHANDAQRSLPFLEMASLLEQHPAAWVSIQHEATDEERAWLAAHGIPHLGDSVADFFDLAGVLAQVDGVLGVDSAPVHLAGAMGIPTWLLLATSPDWRWGTEGHRTAWYHSVNLLRQRKTHGWGEPLVRVARGLRRLRKGVR